MRLKICVSDVPDLVTGKQPSQIICYKRRVLRTPIYDNLGYRRLPIVSVIKQPTTGIIYKPSQDL